MIHHFPSPLNLREKWLKWQTEKKSKLSNHACTTLGSLHMKRRRRFHFPVKSSECLGGTRPVKYSTAYQHRSFNLGGSGCDPGKLIYDLLCRCCCRHRVVAVAKSNNHGTLCVSHLGTGGKTGKEQITTRICIFCCAWFSGDGGPFAWFHRTLSEIRYSLQVCCTRTCCRSPGRLEW